MAAQTIPADANEEDGGTGPRRRDFINIAAVSTAGVGALITLYPLLSQMAPSADVRAEGAPISVDLKRVAPGQQIVVSWRSLPIFVVRRTPAELEELRKPDLLSRLSDPHSQVDQQPAYAKNWSRSIKPEILVLIAICTHLGCIPTLKATRGELGAAWPGGYFCPCHGSKYDLAGRVFKNVPAPDNLPVPPYHFIDDNTLSIGANPSGSSFSVSSIKQM